MSSASVRNLIRQAHGLLTDAVNELPHGCGARCSWADVRVYPCTLTPGHRGEHESTTTGLGNTFVWFDSMHDE